MDVLLWLLIVAFVWLAVLTVGLLALVRAVGALHLTRQRAAAEGYIDATDQGLTVDLENDGPPIGSPIPEAARQHMLQVDGLLARFDSAKEVDLVMFSNTCGPCVERARDWADLLRGGGGTRALTVALVSGKIGGDVTRELDGVVDLVVEGDEATSIGQSMEITSVPFAIRLADGVVAAKSYIRYPQHLMSTFEIRETEPA